MCVCMLMGVGCCYNHIILMSILGVLHVIQNICDRIWEKGPYRAFKKNRVITTGGKSRL